MTGIIGAVSFVGRLYDAIKGTKIGEKIGIDPNSAGYADLLKRAGIKDVDLKLLTSDGDMVKMLDKSILEPTIIISKSMYARKDIDKVIEASVDAYISFYLAVFKTLTNIYSLDPAVALSLLANKGFDSEEYKTPIAGLVDLEDLDYLPIDAEAIKTIEIKNSMDVKKSNEDFLVKTVIKTVDLVINKTKNMVSINNFGDKDTDSISTSFSIPVIVKANIHVVDIDDMVSSFSQRGAEASLTTRFLKWKIGAISTSQFLTASDLLEDYQKNLLNSTNFSSYINKKSVADLNILNVINKHRGLNKMVVTYIMSEKELKQVSKGVGYDIDTRTEKQKLMNAMLAFNITAINTDRDKANTYISSISGFSTSDIKKLGNNGKSNNDAIEMLATALITNKPF